MKKNSFKSDLLLAIESFVVAWLFVVLICRVMDYFFLLKETKYYPDWIIALFLAIFVWVKISITRIKES